mgnify:CR=1 FL=1
MTLITATNHIKDVASDYLIEVSEHGQVGSIAEKYDATEQAFSAMQGEIRLPSFPLQTWRGYAIALHELGHFLDPTQLPNLDQDIAASHLCMKHMFSDNRITSELGAWRWARDNALVWNKEMDDVRNFCLLSYADVERWHQFGIAAVEHGRFLMLDN